MGKDKEKKVRKEEKKEKKEKEEKKLKRKLDDVENGDGEGVDDQPTFFVDTEGATGMENDNEIENVGGDGEEKKSKKSRGRREKQKLEKKNVDVDVDMVGGDEKNGNDGGDEHSIFFGIVDRVELEYFKSAESTLSANAFANSEERLGFIAGVLDEATGKELKLVTNSICAKLVERLILLADNRQLLKIFNAFSGHFLNLSKHKYSSHCVETLMVRSAALVEKEILAENPLDLYKEVVSEEEENVEEQVNERKDEQLVTMEILFIRMINELKPEIKKLITHEYASHVLRLLLLILSGSKLPSTKNASSIRSKKSKITRKAISMNDNEEFETSYQVPNSFKAELQQILVTIGNEITTVNEVRELAIHKIASPVIQLIVNLECNVSSSEKKKQRKKAAKATTITSLLFQMNPNSEKESTEESFVEYLLSDPIGLFFFESVINSLPTSTTQRIYNQYMGYRLDKLLKRDGVSNFIFPTLLKKLPPNEVENILDNIIPLLEILINSNNHLIIRAALSSSKSLDYKQNEFTKIIENKFKSNNASEFLENVLKLQGSTLGNSKDDDWPTTEERHRSLFTESLVEYSPKFLKTISLGFIELPEDKLIQVTKHSIFSHVLQSCLVPESDIIIRRRLLNNLVNHTVDLACNAYASHIIDSLWKYTYKLKFFRERIAEQLVNQADIVKRSLYGKNVWKNWDLEKYSRKRFEWWKLVKEQEDKLSEQLGQSREQIESKQKKPTPQPRQQQHNPSTGPNRDNKLKRPFQNKKPYDRPTPAK